MILILEQDLQLHGLHKFFIVPRLYISDWGNKVSWRLVFGFWSISYYPNKDLDNFFTEAKTSKWSMEGDYKLNIRSPLKVDKIKGDLND